MSIPYSKVIAYLDAVADKANNENPNRKTENAPHKRFWRKDGAINGVVLTHDEFVNGTVPGNAQVLCQGARIPIIDHANPAKSPFFLVLTDVNSFCGKGRMPKGGPFITNPGYTVMVDGVQVTGDQIKNDLLNWLQNGFTEDGGGGPGNLAFVQPVDPAKPAGSY